ncbi:cadherin-related family member 2 [Scyliorhinus canicula]|uniref:cadherin-related family member 2 n=1 Tax=Scyliorhinus canicula TaxID=7830 RepID=UPI0018F564E5|nr:cadherin-related family member 2 [Scyliorhinus canicula]XP_038651546.1 cadherin-related family member 2 [Scyliorhinus canicula]
MSSHEIMCSLLLVLSLFLKASAQSPPTFATNMSVVYVDEDTKIGAEAYTMLAFDKDHDSLTYSMSGANSVFFKVDKNTGIVTVARELDRETNDMLEVTIGVSDGTNSDSMSQIIILNDANDNSPVFVNATYTVSVYENETKGATLFTVKAVDRDQGAAGKIKYAIVEVLPGTPSLFGIQQNGNVILNGTLNYAEKSTYYQLKIEASDFGGMYHGEHVVQKNFAFAFINVEDVPDRNPIFLNIPYQTTVPENSSVGTTVFQVLAIDGDRGIEDEITYAIQSSKPPNLFEINTRSGDIFVSGFLNREELLDFNTVVELKVTATEQHLDINGAVASAVTSVSITVTDINDNTPAFYNCNLGFCNFTEDAKVNSFKTSIPEHISAGVPIDSLTMVARDPDQGMNGTFSLSLHGEDASIFTVYPQEIKNMGMVQIIVRNSSAIDYEQRHDINITVVANDTTNPTECCSSATLIIYIVDINDHSPEFPEQTYILSVKEHEPVGTEIGTVRATDPDSGSFGRITYSLLPKNIRKEFNVNSTTGEIIVENSTTLDREKRPVYYATLQATDGGNRIGTTALEIVLEDINDFHPVIARDSYTAFIKENKGNELNIRIEAFDNDQEGTNNSEIRYTIAAGDYQQNFTIDPITGVLRSVGPIDREDMKSSLDGKIILIVKAYDLGIPKLSTTVNVTIDVQDENDHSPVFTKSVYNASVMEHTLGAFVTLVKASDNDVTEINNRVTYRIETGSTGTFLIRTMLINKIDPKQYQGNITVDPTIALDYDKGPKSYTLGISASDSGFPSKSASATVYVTVLDMNDETPILDPDSLKDLDVMENNTQLGIVRDITASDIDTNHSLIYQLVSVVCLKSKIIDAEPNAPCLYWFGLYDNGSLYVNESSVIDYEVYDQVDITIRVTDLYTEKNNPSTTGKLTINIVDENDNIPVFLAFERVSVIVPELAPISAEVATVKASDNDTGKNAEINFVVTKVLFIFSDGQENKLPDVFEASRATLVGGEYTATIKIKSSLDKTLRGQYKVTIEARDGGKPTLSATSYLDLITVDESYKTRLEFSITPDEVQRNMNEIIVILREATHSNPYVAGVNAVSNEKVQRLARNAAKAVMEVYFVYNNGTAIPPENMNSILQFNPEAVKELIDLGLLNIKEPAEPIDTARPLLFTIGGLVAAFIILIAIMITIVVCSRQSYERKIKSITAMNTAKTITVDALQNGPVVPGTNKYTSEGANPVWNTDIEVTTDLGFEEANSDRASINSLDVNIVDAILETPTRKSNGEMAEKTINSHPVDEKTKPLSVALDDHDNNKEKTSGETGDGFYNKTTLNSTDI